VNALGKELDPRRVCRLDGSAIRLDADERDVGALVTREAVGSAAVMG